MKESDYLKIIKEELTDSSLIGDDCAFLSSAILKNNGLFVTQDSLVEDVHFKLSGITPYQLGKKSVSVNLSDLAAVCATPLYITISLSLSKDITDEFVRDFYRGVNEVCTKYGVIVAGGDLTGSEKIYVSICAIGKKETNVQVSRKNAVVGDYVVTTGVHGDSAAGLMLLLQESGKSDNSLIKAHLEPVPQIEKSKILANIVNSDFAMMDTSDGLADALYKISKDSKVSMEIDFDLIPVSDDLKRIFQDSYKPMVMWGGEDYQLLFCIEPSIYNKLDKNKFFKIGEVVKQNGDNIVNVKDGKNFYIINSEVFEKKSFKHFGEE